MTRNPRNSIRVTQGFWMHIPHTQVRHRLYPEVCGQGRTLPDAARHLIEQLTTCLDFVHGRKRKAVARAIADVRTILAPPTMEARVVRSPPLQHDATRPEHEPEKLAHRELSNA